MSVDEIGFIRHTMVNPGFKRIRPAYPVVYPQIWNFSRRILESLKFPKCYLGVLYYQGI
jgi:hypothetical protein